MEYKVGDKVLIVANKDIGGYYDRYIGSIATVVLCHPCNKYSLDIRSRDGDMTTVWHGDELAPNVVRGFQSVAGYGDIPMPSRATKCSAGYDIASAIAITLLPQSVTVIPTGLKAYMPDDEYLAIHLRSSMAKKGITLANNVGIVDADYYDNKDNEGHICVLLRNNNNFSIDISMGERIAQGIFQRYLMVDGDTSIAERTGGFGSTGGKQ